MAAITRGKVECRVSFGRKAADAGSQALNHALLADLAGLQDEVTRQLCPTPRDDGAELLRWPGVIEEAADRPGVAAGRRRGADREDAWPPSSTAAAREGAALRSDAAVAHRRDGSDRQAHHAADPAGDRPVPAKGDRTHAGSAGPGRPRRPAGADARRKCSNASARKSPCTASASTSSEELSRLAAHLDETRHILKKGGQVGKRLDFMMQELNREANTLGSKASVKELADASMELKLLIEQMREQVQNLE